MILKMFDLIMFRRSCKLNWNLFQPNFKKISNIMPFKIHFYTIWELWFTGSLKKSSYTKDLHLKKKNNTPVYWWVLQIHVALKKIKTYNSQLQKISPLWQMSNDKDKVFYYTMKNQKWKNIDQCTKIHLRYIEERLSNNTYELQPLLHIRPSKTNFLGFWAFLIFHFFYYHTAK